LHNHDAAITRYGVQGVREISTASKVGAGSAGERKSQRSKSR
jgi:hypothetical protein